MLRRPIFALLLLAAGTALAQHPEDAFVGQKAPELKAGDAWINSQPLKLEQLRGKPPVGLCSDRGDVWA